jgi:2-amino-4-hydroxy-6-hydroxymethyldihydropteridine diphosphokinase
VTRAILSVGANVGDRLACLQSAVDGLGEAVIAVSPVYETEPWGGVEQPPFLNAVLVASSSDVDARSWLDRAWVLERRAGRKRTVHWGPRTLDVDVVTVDGVTSADPELTLPHPRAHERAFVLAPWLDVQPDAILPGHGRVADLLAAVGTETVRRRDDIRLSMPRGTPRATQDAPHAT